MVMFTCVDVFGAAAPPQMSSADSNLTHYQIRPINLNCTHSKIILCTYPVVVADLIIPSPLE